MNARASKRHLVEVARKVGVPNPDKLKKTDLVYEIEKANAKATARARQKD